MVRLGAIFIGICMVLIAASLGAVLFLLFKFDIRTSALIALGALVAMVLYNTISSRLADRRTLGDQIADLSRGTADLARQVAEMARRLNAMEAKVDKAVDRARTATEPLTAEMGELGTLVRQIAETVAAHAVVLQKQGFSPAAVVKPMMPAPAVADGALHLTEKEAVSAPLTFQGLSRDAIIDVIANAIAADRIDLYLQPIVTLPQRKVRYYEAMSRLRTEAGEIVPAGDFIDIAESVGLMPKIDNVLLFRCVQVVRRLQLKSRDVGLFCNVSAATLTDAGFFKQFLDFMDANRALNNALMFEFSQTAYHAFGPLEHESLAALAELGFRFSMDHVTDLRMEPKELADHWFRFLKVPAKLLLDKTVGAQFDIRPEDLADLLARSGIDLIAERIESEGMVLDLLDYDVRFGQGFLFSPPRPVRAEALQGGEIDKPAGETLAAAG
ncbi:MAG TPA: EAL domain-containing protein [Pseudolabrys sp.]|jgi:cyclic-di-GMP phosphodiesterase TipF (flagellum assembly factor)|nr:EAL domain-containing protein [Pseudolabrys sp.]